MPECTHVPLLFGTIDSVQFEYRQPKPDVLRKASSTDGPRRKKVKGNSSAFELPPVSTFPAPVILPGDELFHDPDYPPQSVQEWLDEEHRNEVTQERRTIYVVPPPCYNSKDITFLQEWSTPQTPTSDSPEDSPLSAERATSPQTDSIVEYLSAFYHPLPVKLFENRLEFDTWEEESKRKHKPAPVKAVGLSTGDEVVRIRCRPSKDGIFQGQLNLDDLLDTTITILPADAYALLMLVDHDIYENDDDDFCCGRAYGGSRVAVVSAARYNPVLDDVQNVNREHSWPASHCNRYILGHYSGKRPASSWAEDTQTLAERHPGSGLSAAVMTSSALQPPSTQTHLDALWLGRVCKTASHELGHCFGIDHCMYYACIMQGTARMAEDVRQPPYLCPIDLSKVIRATGSMEKERYKALLEVCEKWKDDKMFAAFGAWIETRLAQTNAVAL
jgi:archaemetzincin